MNSAEMTRRYPWPRSLGPVHVSTLQVLLGLVFAYLVMNWISRDVVMARQIHDLLLEGSMDGVGMDRQWALYRRMAGWSYLITPIVLAVQVGLVALLLQLSLALQNHEAPFARLFRVAVVAQVVLAAQLAWVLWYRAGLDGPAVTAEAFYRPLGTLHTFFPGLQASASALAGSLSAFELVWFGVLYTGLARTDGVRRRAAAIVVGGLFFTFNALQVGLVLYLRRLGI